MQHNRVQHLHIAVLTIVVIYTLLIQKFLFSTVVFGVLLDPALALLTSIGFYRALLLFIYWLINNSAWLLRLYWGPLYLRGVWSYQYGADGEKRYGIWRVSQDMFSITITGYGIDATGKVRSRYRAITQPFENHGTYEIVFARSDEGQGDEEVYSKTTLLLGNYQNEGTSSPPDKMRCHTTIFGGNLSGSSHYDVQMKKHQNFTSEDEIVTSMLMIKAGR